MTRPRKIPTAQAGIEPWIILSLGRRLNHYANRAVKTERREKEKKRKKRRGRRRWTKKKAEKKEERMKKRKKKKKNRVVSVVKQTLCAAPTPNSLYKQKTEIHKERAATLHQDCISLYRFLFIRSCINNRKPSPFFYITRIQSVGGQMNRQPFFSFHLFPISKSAVSFTLKANDLE